MKKILLLIVFVIGIFIFDSHAYAEPTVEAPSCKALIGFKYYNTATWGITTKEVREKIIDERIAPLLAKNKCEMITDEKYLVKLQERGYSDYSSAEKADLLDIYKNEGLRYLIFIEVEPLRRANPFGYESSAHVKIIDTEFSKYMFNGKIYKVTKWGGGGTVFEELGDDIKKILHEKVLESKIRSTNESQPKNIDKD